MKKFFKDYFLKVNKGFTLLEIIIAIGILSTILVPISNLVLNSFKIANEGKIKQEAVNIGQKYMEKIKSDNWIQLDKIIDEGKTFSEYGYPSEENGFKITYTLLRDKSYLVPPPKDGTESNVYDYKFEISEDSSWVNVYDKVAKIDGEQKEFPNFEIANNSNTITYKINSELKTIDKTKGESEDIIIRVDINRNFSDGLPVGAPSKQPDNTLTVTAENKSSGQLIFYFVESSSLEQQVTSQIVNLGGSIVKYDNIKKVNSSIGYGAKSRIYKITIQVEKRGQKIINESYKTFY